MVVELGNDYADGGILARAQVTGHDIGFVVEATRTIAHLLLGTVANIGMILQSAADGRDRYLELAGNILDGNRLHNNRFGGIKQYYSLRSRERTAPRKMITNAPAMST